MCEHVHIATCKHMLCPPSMKSRGAQPALLVEAPRHIEGRLVPPTPSLAHALGLRDARVAAVNASFSTIPPAE
eukprot:CAMPEP_0183375294 /NCGR_PEP_ID=MMETSP0164_2-20130417/116907_1 /TAXON_ID=221442 /ORGANISM="Coccolithus pelagicus ssp braarudi, Strain PLY182g" /LENGTH=72 /DNA_ID=CAMNT_0025552441 /DNA_START=85 /DNA_END=300 /DNA_ORIENTATION=+